jgi:predicted NUDIX family phosphoesterase
MFLRVVDTIVTQELEVSEELNNEQSCEGIGLSETDETELSDVHGESLRRETD